MQEHTRRRTRTWALVRVSALAGMFSATACSDKAAEDGADETVGMPNPAAVFCADQGGEYLLDSGECRLADGTVVDGWEYYRENVDSAE